MVGPGLSLCWPYQSSHASSSGLFVSLLVFEDVRIYFNAVPTRVYLALYEDGGANENHANPWTGTDSAEMMRQAHSDAGVNIFRLNISALTS